MTFHSGILLLNTLLTTGPGFARDHVTGAVLDAEGREIVIPSPRKIEFHDDFIPLEGSSVSAPAADSDPAIREAQSLISETVRSPGVQVSSTRGNGAPGATIHLLTFDGLPDRFPSLGLKPPSDSRDAYSIRFVENGASRDVVCAGVTPRAVYYAATTLVQLFRRDPSSTRVRKVTVDDWPSYEVRFFPHDSWGNRGDLSTMEGGPDSYIEFMDWVPRCRVNTFGCGKMLRWKSFFTENNVDREWVERLSRHAAAKDIVDFLLYLHVGGWGESPIDLSTDDELDTLIRAYGIALDAGAKHIGILADDYRGFTDKDKKRFGTYEDKHIHLVNGVCDAVRAKRPDALILYCAYGYQTEQKELAAETAKIARAIPSDVAVIWTGPETRSRQITPEDMDEVTDILGRKPFLWDNTIYATYDWRRPIKFLNAFTSELPPDMPARLDRGIHINGAFATREIEKVHLLTAADYLWNHRDYDPDTSLRRAIARVFGSWDAVNPVLAWRDNYLDYNYWVRHDRFGDHQAGFERDRELLRAIESRSTNSRAVSEIRDKFPKPSGRTLATYIPQQMALQFETNSRWKKRDFDLGVDRRILQLYFPLDTPSRPGDHATVAWTANPPEFQSHLFFAFFLFDELWPTNWIEYRFLEVLADGEVLFREDLATKSRMPRWVRVDVTEKARKKETLELAVRVIDDKPASNYETRVILGRFHLVEDEAASGEM